MLILEALQTGFHGQFAPTSANLQKPRQNFTHTKAALLRALENREER